MYQHGTFDAFRKTYGCGRDFKDKGAWVTNPPQFGPFKIGNLPKVGHNKTLGSNPIYIEDPIEDTVTYQKNIRNPIWKDPSHTTTTPFNPMSSTYKNTSGQLRK